MSYVLVFITGSGDRSIDQGMVVAKKGYDNKEFDWIINEAAEAGIDAPEIIGEIDIPNHLADIMCEGRMYIG